MKLKRQHTSSKSNLEAVGLTVILLSAIVSFLAGSLLGEDSVGGARFDFYVFHWPLIESFSKSSWITAITGDYGAANNPLLYMIYSLLPLHDDRKLYHAMTFGVALSIWPLLSWAYYRRYFKYGFDWLWASFGASTILISPGFRSSAFWGDTDYLPLLFCAGTSLLLSRFQDFEADKAPALGPFTLVALAAISACAFYTRQYYAFLPVFAAWIVLIRTTTSPILILGVFFLAMVPEMFLIYLWKGVNSPRTQWPLHPAIINVLKVGAVIGLLSLPIFAGCIRRSPSDVLPRWWGPRSTFMIVGGLLVFILALWATEWPELGGGIIVKAGLRMGPLGNPFVLGMVYFGLVSATVFSMSSPTNALLVGAYLAPFLVAPFTYQHYLEPSLSVTLFLFADTQTARTIFNKRVLILNFTFGVLILAAGIVYYDFFSHLAEIPG